MGIGEVCGVGSGEVVLDVRNMYTRSTTYPNIMKLILIQK